MRYADASAVLKGNHMQPACADMRVVPWAVLPDRFPYIRSALMSTARGHRPALRAGAGASRNTASTVEQATA